MADATSVGVPNVEARAPSVAPGGTARRSLHPGVEGRGTRSPRVSPRGRSRSRTHSREHHQDVGISSELFTQMMKQHIEMSKAVSQLATGQDRLALAITKMSEVQDRHPLTAPPSPWPNAASGGSSSPGTPFAQPPVTPPAVGDVAAVAAAAAAAIAPNLVPPTAPPAFPPSLGKLDVAEGVLAALKRNDDEKKAASKTMKSLPKALITKLDKAGKEFEVNLTKLQRARVRLQRATSKTDFYDNPDNTGKTAAGSKPFKLNEASSEFDTVWSRSASADFAYVVPIPREATLRQAWEALHTSFIQERDRIEKEAATAFLTKVRGSCGMAQLSQTFADIVSEYIRDDRNSYVIDEELGLEQPVTKDLVVPQELFQDKVVSVYNQAVAKIF